MKLVINNEQRDLEVRTVADLLAELNMTQQPVAVEVNRELIPKRLHESTLLHERDVVELVRLVGGG